MLKHLNSSPAQPARVVILGASGFVGSATNRLLRARGIPVVGFGRSEIDLLSESADEHLVQTLRKTDSVVVIAARAPVRDNRMLGENIQIMENLCSALATISLHHVIYISSDAVYRDSHSPLIESSCAEPSSLHGVMHLARELMLKSVLKSPLAILRPSLLYGQGDPHNGYGPNRFRRLAAAGQEIVLFGEGEERRDHVHIDDAAEIIVRVLMHRSEGTLNIATGHVSSFRSIAEQISAMAAPRVTVRDTPRVGPMPHGGYRAFDNSACFAAFSDLRYTRVEVGLSIVGLSD